MQKSLLEGVPASESLGTDSESRFLLANFNVKEKSSAAAANSDCKMKLASVAWSAAVTRFRANLSHSSHCSRITPPWSLKTKEIRPASGPAVWHAIFPSVQIWNNVRIALIGNRALYIIVKSSSVDLEVSISPSKFWNISCYGGRNHQRRGIGCDWNDRYMIKQSLYTISC